MIALVSTGLIICRSTTATAKTATIAILPFAIHSQKDISFISAGIMEMLKSRLSWKDHVSVIEKTGTPGKSNSQALLKAILKEPYDLNSAGKTAYDYVLTGSITEFAGAFSLDVKVFNTKNSASHTFFNQAGTMTKIIPKIDIIAARINKKIFNRTTAALKISENNGKNSETRQKKIIRQNPEELMNQEFGNERKKHRPFWKFWGKKNNQNDNDTQDQGEEKENKPFWKIW